MTAASVRQNILAAAVILMVSGCGYYNEVTPSSVAAQAPFRQGQTIGFEIVKTILSRNRCFECHTVEKGNRGGINLETYGNAKPLAVGIAGTTLSGFMPLGGPKVSAGDQAVLQAWADAGAPETSNLPVPGSEGPSLGPAPAPIQAPVPTPSPAGLDFARVKAAIFTPHCIGCHAGFADYTRVTSRLPDIQRAIDTNFMPKGGPALSQELKTMLADWIAAGAPETLRGEPGEGGPGKGDGETPVPCDDDDDPSHGQHCCGSDPRHGEHCCGTDPRHGDDDCDNNDDDFKAAN